MEKTARLILDFDGTLTSSVGKFTVWSDFYKKFLKNPDNVKNYSTEEYKDEKTILQIMKEYDQHTKNRYSEMYGITNESLWFIRENLKNEKIKITIISKNRKEYIVASLKYKGLTNEEINKITIFDASYNKYKKELVLLSEEKCEKATVIMICDDDHAELLAQKQGLSKFENVEVYCHPVGKFEWKTIKNKLDEYLR